MKEQFRLLVRLLIFGGCVFLVLGGCKAPDNPTAAPVTATPEATKILPDLPTVEINTPTHEQPTPEGTPSLTLSVTSLAKEALTQVDALKEKHRDDLGALKDIPRYDIQLDLDYNAQAYQGQLTLTYTNTEGIPQESLYFRLFPNGSRSYGDGSLEVANVSQDGEAVETSLTLEDSVLEVKLANTLENGESTSITMDFSGEIPRDFEGGGYGIYNFSHDVLALSGWFPLLAVYDEEGWNLDPTSDIGDSVYSDMALFDVSVNLPKDIMVAATGIEAARSAQNGRQNIRYVSGPMRDFFLIMSPNFQVSSEEVGGTTVNSYFYSEDQAGGEQALSDAVKAVQAYTTRFGEYPYTELDVVEAPMQYAAGVEFPGIVLVTDDAYSGENPESFTVITAHEVAHQWWYNLVGNDVIDDPWLDEALTTYSSLLFWEVNEGPYVFQQVLQFYQDRYDELVAAGKDDVVTKDLAYFEGLEDPGIYGDVVYIKGALFFQAVREKIGDKAFFGALKDYFESKRYQIANPEDLLAAFEASSGQELDDLYQEWLYSAKE